MILLVVTRNARGSSGWQAKTWLYLWVGVGEGAGPHRVNMKLNNTVLHERSISFLNHWVGNKKAFQLQTQGFRLRAWYKLEGLSYNPHYNDHDDVSNHQPHGCLLNRVFRRRSKKTSKLRVTGLCAGNSPGPVNAPHKGPVTRKMFPFDDVIMLAEVFISALKLQLFYRATLLHSQMDATECGRLRFRL